MKTEPPSPDDFDGSLSMSSIEQRLKQLQPRPANVDLESLMALAREQSVPTPLRLSDTRHLPVPTTAFLPLLTAGIGGAVLGAALTCLFFLTTAPAMSNSTNPARVAGSTSALPPNEGPSAVDRGPVTLPQSPANEQTVRDTFNGESISLDWPDGGWMISTPLVEVGSFGNHRPLAAGSQLPISRRADSQRTVRSATVNVKSPAATSPSTPAVDRNSPTTFARDTDKLLEELLGTRPDSAL